MNDITIEGFSPKQMLLADLVYACQTRDQVDALVRALPAQERLEAQVVIDMIILAYIDQIDSTDLAEKALEQYK
jgi:hypothetical protein